jgi:hypothetical protein
MDGKVGVITIKQWVGNREYKAAEYAYTFLDESDEKQAKQLLLAHGLEWCTSKAWTAELIIEDELAALFRAENNDEDDELARYLVWWPQETRCQGDDITSLRYDIDVNALPLELTMTMDLYERLIATTKNLALLDVQVPNERRAKLRADHIKRIVAIATEIATR